MTHFVLIRMQFPYALSSLPSVLTKEWDTPELMKYVDAFPPQHRISRDAVLIHVRELMAADLKIPYLKTLQGYLWLSGYKSGELRCPLFSDVAPALRKWTKEGKRVVIYSSGSVAAQKLLLEYTTEGDLREYISGWYDTMNAGMKQEKASYSKIVSMEKEVGAEIEAGQWCFFSDNVKEIEASRAAGMQAVLTFRPENADVSEKDKKKHRCCDSFGNVALA